MARDYAMVLPQFWTGRTGRQLRALGPEAQLVALYLLTNPHANWIGLYQLTLPTLAHETSLPIEGARKALRSLSEAEFAYFDEDAEEVWVPEMAHYQIAPELKASDKRCKGVEKDAARFAKSRFYGAFLARYQAPFNLSGLPPAPSNAWPSEAPSKGHRSQDQDHDQDQDHEKDPSSLRSEVAPSCAGALSAPAAAESSTPGLAPTSLPPPGAAAEAEPASPPPAPSAAAPGSSPPPALALVPPPAEPPVAVFPCVGKGPREYAVTAAKVRELAEAFPAVDVALALKQARLRLDDHPNRRKTHQGMPGFLSRWMGREQNRGGTRPPGPAAAPGRWPALARLAAELAKRFERGTVALPPAAAADELEPLAARDPDAAADACEDAIETAIDAGRLPEDGPTSLAWCAAALRSMPEPRPRRPPGENPRPGDADFNDPAAWPDFNAFSRRSGAPLPVEGGAIRKVRV